MNHLLENEAAAPTTAANDLYTETYTVCSNCADILSQGFTEWLSDEEHEELEERLTAEAMQGGTEAYWMEYIELSDEFSREQCETCNSYLAGARYTAYLANCQRAEG